jgi:formate-dependent nitrite reductase cytochrome c552 subunit
MGCHKFVNTDAEPIKFIKDKFDKNEPIPWVKVHDLPDYVRFSHQPHVLAQNADGKPLLQCQTCHGPVEKMTTAVQWAPMQMGWCVDCHNQTKVPAQNGKPAIKNAPVSCNTCHY